MHVAAGQQGSDEEEGKKGGVRFHGSMVQDNESVCAFPWVKDDEGNLSAGVGPRVMREQAEVITQPQPGIATPIIVPEVFLHEALTADAIRELQLTGSVVPIEGVEVDEVPIVNNLLRQRERDGSPS